MILCCHKDRGYWRKKEEQAPVSNSVLALLLAKTLRKHKTVKEAMTYFYGVSFAIERYLHEFVEMFKEIPELREYIYKPESKRVLTQINVRKSRGLLKTEEFLHLYCSDCLPIHGVVHNNVEIGPTGVKMSPKDWKEYKREQEEWQKAGEQILEATQKTFTELKLRYSPSEVSRKYYPPGETTTELLLKLSGYTFGEWEKNV